jgi:hypothetical protein
MRREKNWPAAVLRAKNGVLVDGKHSERLRVRHPPQKRKNHPMGFALLHRYGVKW